MERETLPTENDENVYHPLEDGCTRVFSLNFDEDDLIYIRLVPCQLRDLGPSSKDEHGAMVEDLPITYRAVSYTWNDTSDLLLLIARDQFGNTQIIFITRSLVSVLEQLRDKFQGFFWVDQISINQADLEERAVQIYLMRQIYEGASHLYVWLGKEDADTQVALEKINDFSNIAREKIAISLDEVRNGDPLVQQRWYGSLFDEMNFDDHVSWNAIATFFQRRWFRRAWIRQEFSSKNAHQGQITFLCGRCSLDAVQICVFAHVFSHLNTRAPIKWQATAKARAHPLMGLLQMSRLYSLQQIRMNKEQNLPLLMLLEENGLSDATDARDKIYCLLGVATDYDPLVGGIPVDYTVAPVTAYCQFVIWFVMTYKTLDVLSYYRLGPNSAELPSWCPDWTTNFANAPLLTLEKANDFRSTPLYRAAGNYSQISTKNQTLPSESVEGGLLLSGIRIATVGQVKPPQDLLNLDQSMTMIQEWYHDPEMLDFFNMTDNKESNEEIFRRTITADLKYVSKLGAQGIARDHVFSMEASDPSVTLMYDLIKGRTMFYTDMSSIQSSSVRSSSTAATTADSPTLTTENESDMTFQKGVIGLGPWQTQPGDELWLLKGGRMLYLLRHIHLSAASLEQTIRVFDPETGLCSDLAAKSDPEAFYVLVGECFVHGIMDGEIVEMMDRTAEDRPLPPPLPLRSMETEFRAVCIC